MLSKYSRISETEQKDGNAYLQYKKVEYFPKGFFKCSSCLHKSETFMIIDLLLLCLMQKCDVSRRSVPLKNISYIYVSLTPYVYSSSRTNSVFHPYSVIRK